MPALPISFSLLTALLLTTKSLPAQQTGNKPPAHAPAVVDICRELKRPLAVCECSADKMQARIAKESFNHYQAVGVTYLRLKRAGKRRRQAWTMAVSERAKSSGEPVDQLTEKMSITADDHLNAIQDCGKQ